MFAKCKDTMANPFSETPSTSADEAFKKSEIMYMGAGNCADLNSFHLETESTHNFDGLFAWESINHQHIGRFNNLRALSLRNLSPIPSDLLNHCPLKDLSYISVSGVNVDRSLLQNILNGCTSLQTLCVCGDTPNLVDSDLEELALPCDLLAKFIGHPRLSLLSASHLALRAIGCKLPRLKVIAGGESAARIVKDEPVFGFPDPNNMLMPNNNNNFANNLEEFNDESCKTLVEKMPNLREIRLSNSAANHNNLTQRGLELLISAFKNKITCLDFGDLVGRLDLVELRKCNLLKTLHASGSLITSATLSIILENNKSTLVSLDISFSDELSEDDVGKIYAKCPNLKNLNVEGIGGFSIFTNVIMDFAGVLCTFTNSLGNVETQLIDF